MNRNVFKIIATVVLAVLAIGFTALMYQFGKAFNRNGTGTTLFLYLVTGPQGVCLLIWPILGPLLPWGRIPKVGLTSVGLALAPLIWVGVVLSLEGLQDDVVRTIWRQAPGVVYVYSAMFLLPTLLGLATGLRGAIVAVKEMTKADA